MDSRLSSGIPEKADGMHISGRLFEQVRDLNP